MDLWMLIRTLLIVFGYNILANVRAESERTLTIGMIVTGSCRTSPDMELVNMTLEDINRDFARDQSQYSFTSFCVSLPDQPSSNKQVTDSLCTFVKKNVIGVIGAAPGIDHTVDTMLTNFGIPFFRIHNYKKTLDNGKPLPSFVVNMAPSYTEAGRTLADYMATMYFDWNRMVIFYEQEKGIGGMRDILEASSLRSLNRMWDVHTRPLPAWPGLGADTAAWNATIVDALTRSRDKSEFYYVLHCGFDTAKHILWQAARADMQMMTRYYHYIVTTPVDTSLLQDLESMGVGFLKHVGATVNFVAFDLDSQQASLTIWKNMENQTQLELWLVHDAVKLLVRGLNLATSKMRVYSRASLLHERNHIRCTEDRNKFSIPQTSYQIKEAIREVAADTKNYMRGVTGKIRLNNSGMRSMDLNIVELGKNLTKVWPKEQSTKRWKGSRLKGRTLRVATLVDAPFVLRNPEANDAIPHSKYTGLCIDVLNIIANKLEFDYVIEEVDDRAYGAKTRFGWNGMVKRLIDGNADIAVAYLAITSARSEVVDFTESLVTSGKQALARFEGHPGDQTFAFLQPFNTYLWLSILLAIVLVSLALFSINVFDPQEKDIDKNSDKKEKSSFSLCNMDLCNSAWYVCVSIVNGSSEVQPRSFAGRILSGVWGFFGVIMLGYYTANLTAFLTISRTVSEIDSIDALAAQTSLKYGILKNSALAEFLRTSTNPTYQRMWNYITVNKMFFDSEKEAIERATKERFAYIGDSLLLQHYARKEPCNLALIGRPFFKSGVGFALQKDSPLTEDISIIIMELRESGTLESIVNEWLKKNTDCSKVLGKINVVSHTKQIQFESLSGVFYVLIVGFFMAIVLSIMECVIAGMNEKKRHRK